MSGIAVVTDTTQYLPQEVVDRHGLSLVSLYVNWDGRTDRESDMPSYDAFYDAPARERRRPAEHLAAVGGRLPRRLRAAARARRRRRLDPPLRRHLGHRALGRAGARRARRARASTPDRIVVLDSRTGAAGHGLMAIAADNAAKGGADAQAAADAAAKLGERMTILFAVDTLEYLRRGGRIGAAQAFLGSALKIKPILSIDSEITPGRARAHAGPRDRPARARAARAARGGRRRLLHPARAGARAGRADRRARPRDLRRATRSSSRRSGR